MLNNFFKDTNVNWAKASGEFLPRDIYIVLRNGNPFNFFNRDVYFYVVGTVIHFDVNGQVLNETSTVSLQSEFGTKIHFNFNTFWDWGFLVDELDLVQVVKPDPDDSVRRRNVQTMKTGLPA